MKKLHICATGFVVKNSGSVSAANAVLLEGLLARGNHISFFTKPSFVDPRTSVSAVYSENQLDVVDCTNEYTDSLWKVITRISKGPLSLCFGKLNASCYNRKLVRSMSSFKQGDVDLWLGDWARGRSKRPTVSYVQGPPGTDAKSVARNSKSIITANGRLFYLGLRCYAKFRLTIGRPPLGNSDHVIVGSQWSRNVMIEEYGFEASRVHSLPYPIDLEFFTPAAERRPPDSRLRLLWLGRFVPRKRLDLFLDGLALAIAAGCDVEAWIIGSSGFVPNYERLMDRFPFPERLRSQASVPRSEVPRLLAQIDVVVQPSEEENFGSSIAEALACGVPVIVGKTNGTADYVCDRSLQLPDDTPRSMAAAIVAMAGAKKEGKLVASEPSRKVAEKWFACDRVVEQLIDILQQAR